jgi:dihydroorotate dehydrogenase
MANLNLVRKTISKILMDYYPQTIRPFLLAMPPDNAHEITQEIFKLDYLWLTILYPDGSNYEGLKTHLGKEELIHPIGVAPGHIKDGDTAHAFLYTCPAFFFVGSVRLNPYEGNPRPRAQRYKNPHSRRYDLNQTGNSFGMPSKGESYVLSQVARIRSHCPIFVSVTGTNSEVIKLTKDFATLPNVSAISNNLSCPTNHLHHERSLDDLRSLSSRLRNETEKQLFTKLAPIDINDGNDLKWFCGVLDICKKYNIGLELFNTKKVREKKSHFGYTGKSSPEYFEKYVKPAVRFAYSYTNGKIPLIAENGIRNGKDVFEALAEGASSVGIASLFMSRGLGSIKYLLGGLRQEMREQNFSSVQELIGYRESKKSEIQVPQKVII